MYKAKWQDTTQNWQFNKLQTAFKEQFDTDLTSCTIKEAFVYGGTTVVRKVYNHKTMLYLDKSTYDIAETGDYEFSCDKYYSLTEEQTTYINNWIIEGITDNGTVYSYLVCEFVDELQDADIDNLQKKAHNLFNS